MSLGTGNSIPQKPAINRDRKGVEKHYLPTKCSASFSFSQINSINSVSGSK